MVNKTQFYKTKVALAVVLSLGLAACGDSDGDANTSTSESVVEDNGGNTLEQVQGSGSVQGTVLDTNGLPVMGATVRLAGQTQTTDASGYYHFTDVAAPGVAGANGDADAVSAGSAAKYTVTITAPAGYASATVEVTAANIQVDSGNNGNVNNGQTEASGQQTTWFDGFLAQADTANLPMFSESVKGVLRDCTTGATLPEGIKLALDFSGIAGSVTGADATNNVTIGVPAFTTTSGAGGTFTFTNLPTDSEFDIIIEGYSAVGEDDFDESANGFDDTVVQTESEGIVNNIGDVNVCAITSNDNIDLHVTNVSSVIGEITDSGTDYGILNQGVNGEDGIVISFNEAMLASELNLDVDGNLVGAVLVKTTGTTTSYITDFTAKLSTTNDSVSVVLGAGEGLVEGDKLSIYLPSHNMQDLANNLLDDAVDTPAGLEDTDNTDYVLLDTLSGKAIYLRVNLCAYLTPTTETAALSAEWVIDADTDLDADESLLSDYNSSADRTTGPYGSFVDGDDLSINGGANIVQLNGDTDTSIRLAKLANEITGLTTITVEHDAARFTLDPKDSSKFEVVVYRNIAGEERKVVTFDSSNLGTSSVAGVYNQYPTLTVSGYNLTAWEDVDSGVFDFTLDGLESGDKVVFIPFDGFGIEGTEDKFATTIVTDVIAPTTVLQESYGLGSLGLVYTADATDGDGGEHVNNTEASAGNPLLWVTPRLYAGTENAWDASTLNVVTHGVFSDLTIASTTNANVYGQPQYAAKEAVDANVGVAFSEELTKVTSSTLAWDVTNGASVTAHVAANNIDNIDGLHSVDTAGDNDVVSVAFDDIMALANIDNNEALGFAGAYTDALGNAALADAKVVFKDALPPFVTSATLESDALTITFNEDIKATGTEILAMRAQAAASAYSATSPQLSTLITGVTSSDVTITGNVAVIDLSDSAVNFTLLAALFTDGTTTTNAYNFADEDAGTVYGHAILDFSNITDTNGFSWDYYTGDKSAVVPNVGTFAANSTPVDATGRLRIDVAPSYYMTDAIGPFAIESSSNILGYAAATLDGVDVTGTSLNGSAITVTINMTHPLDFDASFDDTLPALNGAGVYDVTSILDIGVDEGATGGLDYTFNTSGSEDLILVGTGVTLDNNGTTGGVLDHGFTLSADKRTLTLTFKAAVATDQINICTTIMDATVGTQAGNTGNSEITSDYSKEITDGNFALAGASCSTPYQDNGTASDNYTRP